MSALNRRITGIEVLIAILITLVLIAGDRGMRFPLMLLRAFNISLFILFALWFSRAVYLSVKKAPDYALFGYSMFAFCLFSWILAFFYPFPLLRPQDLILKDLAFHAGVPAPLWLLLFLAFLKMSISQAARNRFKEAFSRRQTHLWKLALAGIILTGFSGLCFVRIGQDIRDLSSPILFTHDVVTSFYHATRGGDDTVNFRQMGSLRVPHGIRYRSLQRGDHYRIAFTQHAHLLLGMVKES